jgi:hypothetical protein
MRPRIARFLVRGRFRISLKSFISRLRIADHQPGSSSKLAPGRCGRAPQGTRLIPRRTTATGCGV